MVIAANVGVRGMVDIALVLLLHAYGIGILLHGQRNRVAM